MSTSAVDNITSHLAETTLDDTGAHNQSDNTAAGETILASAAEGRRLYIGNLAYATTEGELKEFFKGYSIETVSIPTNPRTQRPVGYAFVDLVTADEAQNAITALSGNEVLDRKVSVQLARKPEPLGEGRGEEVGSGGEGGRRRGGGRGRGRFGRARGGRGGRARGGRRGENGTYENPEATSEEAPLHDSTNDDSTAKEVNEETKDAKAKTREPREPREYRAPRERRQRGPPEDGIPSKTKIMVANLPYDLSQDQLKEMFVEYSPISAKVALRPIPRFMVRKLLERNEPRKGRGFGFVTLPSEELQQKAVSEMNGKEIEGREIAVKIAIDSPVKDEEDPANINGNASENVAADTTANTSTA